MIFVTHDREEVLAVGERACVLNSGTVEQVGTPAELYRAPVSEFVAYFLGDTNFLEGVLRKKEESWVMDCPNNVTVSIAKPVSAVEGEHAKILVRPELLKLSSSSGVEATITQKDFLGSHTRYSVQLTSGEIMNVLVQNSSYEQKSWSMGESTHVTFNPNDAVFLPKAEVE